MFPAVRLGEKNLRTGLLRVLEKAGIPVWRKLFQNLRASRETELMRLHRANLVHAWMGNTEGVAADHYLMATDEDFDRAAGKATLKATLSALISAAQTVSLQTRTTVSPAIAKDTVVEIPPRGVERNEDTAEKTTEPSRGDVGSDVAGEKSAASAALATSPALSDLAARLAALSPEVLAALQVLFSGLPKKP